MRVYCTFYSLHNMYVHIVHVAYAYCEEKSFYMRSSPIGSLSSSVYKSVNRNSSIIVCRSFQVCLLCLFIHCLYNLGSPFSKISLLLSKQNTPPHPRSPSSPSLWQQWQASHSSHAKCRVPLFARVAAPPYWANCENGGGWHFIPKLNWKVDYCIEKELNERHGKKGKLGVYTTKTGSNAAKCC